MKTKFIKKLSLIILLYGITMSVYAQPPFPPGHGEPDDQPAPVGAGLIILLISGAVYGCKKTYDLQNSKNKK